jgi:MFS family permease
MVATLPGRTHGLGLITEPLLTDLRLGRVDYALVNLWATLLGAAFCLPCGWLLDRLGGRATLFGVTLGLAASVLLLCSSSPAWGAWLAPGLFVLILLTRGLGQSALSVVSLALMGRAAGRHAGVRVGVYSAVVAVGFMGAFAAVKFVLERYEPGWRLLWGGIGVGVAAFGAAGALLIGRSESTGGRGAESAGEGMTLPQALATPAFWVFAGATSLYGLVAAGVSLFNQSILAEREFDRSVFLTITTMTPLVGLAANLATGWLASRVCMGKLLGAAMALLTAALLCFPLVQTLWQVYLYAVVMGVAGGMVTVIFFGVWGKAFGTAHLGKVQGAAQMLTVLASAVGPLLLAWGQRVSGSYVGAFQAIAAASALFAVAAWFVPVRPFAPVRQGLPPLALDGRPFGTENQASADSVVAPSGLKGPA